MCERLRGALHTGVKRALAIISSHYVGVDLPAISDGYVLPNDDEEADAVVTKLMEAAEGLGTALARRWRRSSKRRWFLPYHLPVLKALSLDLGPGGYVKIE